MFVLVTVNTINKENFNNALFFLLKCQLIINGNIIPRFPL